MTYEFHQCDCLDWMRAQPAASVNLVFTSPPYPLKTERYPGARKKLTWREWVSWMADVVEECCRVSSGFVLVNANNPVKDGECLPATELLQLSCYERGIKLERPIIWHKNSAPNKRPWWVNDWEPVMGFYKPPRPTTWNWEAIASPPKYIKGGAFRQRSATGERRQGGAYPQTKLARPRDVLRVTVGGGHLGSADAHLSEAPFPEKLVLPFVLALTNEGDKVLDPFSGSGTTVAVAARTGRHGIGLDIRQSQVDLGRRRLAEYQRELIA